MGGRLCERTAEMLKGNTKHLNKRVNKRQRHSCIWTTKGFSLLEEWPASTRKDKTVINFPPHMVTSPPRLSNTLPVTHAHTQSATMHSSLLNWMDCPSMTCLSCKGGDCCCLPTKECSIIGSKGGDRMLNCFRVNNLLFLHEFTFACRLSGFGSNIKLAVGDMELKIHHHIWWFLLM